MANPTNFLPDTNPFNLAAPPEWFLKRLWDFDQSLVIVPSREGAFYRLGQRRPLTLAIKLVNDMMKEQADAAMLASHGLVPVTTIMAEVNWDNPLFFFELGNRAPWRLGGADQVEKELVAKEQAANLQVAAQNDDINRQLAGDAWKYYNIKIGTRLGMATGRVRRPVGSSPAVTSKPTSSGLVLPSTFTGDR